MPAEISLPIATNHSNLDARAYVETVVRRSGSSFYWGMRRLETHRRRAIYAVYAFCREVDDIVDDEGPLDEKKRLLNLWRDEVERLYSDAATHPITNELLSPAREFELRREDFLAVIDGMEMDLDVPVRISNFDTLDLYCDRAASAVGRLCVRIFGLPADAGVRLAFHLGRAMQLTNVLRDIGEDAARDRVYLPVNEILLDGESDQSVQHILTAPKFEGVCETLADQAQNHFDQARSISNSLPMKHVRPAVMMMEVYQRTLDSILQRGWRDLRCNVGPSKVVKLWIAFRYGFLS
jgi:squalene synthase HpnD